MGESASRMQVKRLEAPDIVHGIRTNAAAPSIWRYAELLRSAGMSLTIGRPNARILNLPYRDMQGASFTRTSIGRHAFVSRGPVAKLGLLAPASEDLRFATIRKYALAYRQLIEMNEHKRTRVVRLLVPVPGAVAASAS
jgi:hypothetical protein